MRKYFLLTILTLCFSVNSYSQGNKFQIKIFYETAIRNHIENLRSINKDGSSAIKVEDLYFVAKSIPDVHLPKKIDSYTINYIDVYSRKNKKILRNGIMAVSIQPLVLQENKISVTLIDFRITYKKRNYDFSNGGGSNTYFEYFCDKNKWEFLKTDFTGI